MKRQLVLAAIIFMSCAREHAVPLPAKTAVPRTRIRVGTAPFLSSAPLFIAYDAGYFADEGLDVEITMLRQAALIPATARGDIDVTSHFVTTALFGAIARGVPLRVVADKGSPTSACPGDGLLASNATASLPRVASSLRGKRISVTEMSVSQFALESFMAREHVTAADYTHIYVERQNAAEALRNGSIDFRMCSDPDLTETVRSGGGTLWLSTPELRPDLEFAVITFGARLIKDRDAGRRFLKAYLRGVARYNEGKTDANVASIARRTQISPDIIRAACWMHVRDDGRVNVDALVDFEKWAQQRGFLDRVLSPSEFADLSYLQEVSGKR